MPTPVSKPAALHEITCILYEPRGLHLLEELRGRGINTASLHHARASVLWATL